MNHMMMSRELEPVSFRNEREVIQSAGRHAIASYLENETFFSLLQASAKIVVFNTRIPIQLAFYALVEHDMPAAPLWDEALCQFVGILTVTDFIDVIRHYSQTETPVSTLLTRTIADVLNDPQMPKPGDFFSVDSTASLKQGCLVLHRNGLDFLPIVFHEDMRVLATVTYTSILEHLVKNFPDQRRLFDDELMDLQIGTYHDDLVTVQPNETLARALQLLHEHNLSALPVVQHVPNTPSDGFSSSSKRYLLGVYSRSDVTFLTMAEDAQQALNNLNMTVGEMLEHQKQQEQPPITLTSSDVMCTVRQNQTLQSVFESFSVKKFHRAYIVDNEHCVLGVVSTRDLIAYFLEE